MHAPSGRPLLLSAALPAAALLVLAGCGGGDDTGSTDDDGAPQTTAEATTGATGEATQPADATTATGGDAAGTEVDVATTSLGEVLVDADGMTLYMYDPDAQGESTCYDQCATAWPPLLTEGSPAAGDGADESLLGTVERTDGTEQVTYDRWPLYYFAQDAAAGDVTGQAKNDVWWVLDADGAPVRDS